MTAIREDLDAVPTTGWQVALVWLYAAALLGGPIALVLLVMAIVLQL